jgi:hypothetical protein
MPADSIEVPPVWARFVEQFAAGWSAPQVESFIEHFTPLFAKDVRMAQPMVPSEVGHEAMARVFRWLFAALPGLRGEVVRWGVAGDALLIELELIGTIGGREVRVRGIDRFMFDADGLVSERHTYMDPAPLLRAALLHPSSWPRLLRANLALSRARRAARRSGSPST